MHASTLTSGRGLIALAAAAAVLALPAAALAHDRADDGGRQTQAGVVRGDGGPRFGSPGFAAAAQAGLQRGRGRGPSAAQLAAKLGLEKAAVRGAMRAARAEVRGVEGRDARRAAFQAALASELGLTQAQVDAAFGAIRADTLSACVDRLLARGVITQDQADAIDAQITAGELDEAHAAIKAAKAAARASAAGA